MDDKLDTRRARYFMQVIDSGSVRGAAEVLGMDASAVSRAVALLEEDCGARLLERRGRGVVPTDAGQLLAGYLRRQHSQKQQLLAQLEGIHKLERGHVDIVAGEGYVDWLMRHSVRRFMAAHPGVTVDLDVGSSEDIAQRVIDERAHIGLLFQPRKDERLRSHGACQQPIEALMLEGHPLAQLTRALRLADLLPYPGAALHRSFGVRQHIEAAELREGLRLNISLTTSSFDAVAHFVMAGLGYALCTRTALPPAGPQVVARPLANTLLSQGRVHLVSRQGRLLPPAAAALLRQVTQDLAHMPQGQPA